MKLYKYFLASFIVTLTIVCSTHIVYANDIKVIDQSHILDTDEKKALTDRINDVVTKYQFDLVILVVNSTDGKDINSYADDYFDENGYGIGSQYDGALFILDYIGREMAISTSGYGITVFTDYGIDYVFDELVDDMSAGHYYQAFDKYITLSEKLIRDAKYGTPYDVKQEATEPKNYPMALTIGICGGLIIALIVTQNMKSKLKSVKPVNNAGQYIDQNGFVLSNSQDIFLYTTLTKTKIPEPTQSSSSSQSHSSSPSRGGSSTHTSSSGRTHGGGSRKF